MSADEQRFWMDQDGVRIQPRLREADICLKCGHPCSHEFDGLWFHPEHWVLTVASERDELFDRFYRWQMQNPQEYLRRLAGDIGADAVERVGSTDPMPPPPKRRAGPGPGSRQKPRGAAVKAADSVPSADNPFAAAVAVVDVDAIWMPDGTRRALPGPIEHLGDLEALGRSLGLGCPPVKWRTYPEAGHIVPTPALWRSLGVDVEAIPVREDKRKIWLQEISANLDALLVAADQGWVFGRGIRAPQLSGMTRLRRVEAERGSVVVVCLQAMDLGSADLYSGEPADVARRLQLFADAVGIPYRGAISTGMDLLDLTMPLERKRGWETVRYDDVGPAHNGMLDGVFEWTRRPDAAEARLDYLHTYDRNGAYLAACSSVLLGLGAPENSPQGRVFEEKRAGWWLVTVPENSDRRVPNILDPSGKAVGEQRWVTTPTLAYATKEQGFDGEIHQAWTWPPERSARLLEGWYRVLRDARNQLMDSQDPQARLALRLVKEIYKRSNGWFAASGARGTPAFQPYWHHAIRAASKIGMLHTVRSIGAQSDTWPLLVADTDVLGYPSDTADPATAWPGRDDGKLKLASKLGNALGGYKPYRSGHLQPQLQYLTGRGWRGRDELSDFRTWNPDIPPLSSNTADGPTADGRTADEPTAEGPAAEASGARRSATGNIAVDTANGKDPAGSASPSALEPRVSSQQPEDTARDRPVAGQDRDGKGEDVGPISTGRDGSGPVSDDVVPEDLFDLLEGGGR